ncbi:MAG: dTDP-4-dehydrorhamnose 3,5-epimerase [Deltaproteobacteria bacterium]|nr:MAG: dTDP-4-dehydrorhamnose 3,5-epimerase [Deltaproteobacteria bacterium]
MKILPSSLPEVLIIEPFVFQDERGFFMETYQQRRYTEAGIESIFVQDNLSCSVRGTLRGLHYQVKHAQAKLVQVIEGTIFDVALDIRRGSPYFGQWTSVHLSDENKRQLFLPAGFAHGFCVLSESAQIVYKATDFYASEDEGGVLWSDPTLAIAWPISEPLLSEKDSQLPCLADILPERLPVYEENR